MKKIYLSIAVIAAFLTSLTTFGQAGCSTLAITSTTPATINCGGSATLTAVSSGTGDDIYWYDAASGGNKVGEGTSFTTPVLDITTSYWATEVMISGVTSTGQGKVSPTGNNPYDFDDYGLIFDATSNFILVDVEVYSTGSGGSLTVDLEDSSGTILQTATVNVPSGSGTTPFVVPLNFNVAPGTDYVLRASSSPSLHRDSSASFPYPLGSVGSITAGAFPSGPAAGQYYYFYNWTISTGGVICESTPRTGVVATVINGDKTVPSGATASVYTDTDNTANFSDSYSGAPGSSCGTTADYLGGNEVVYYYTAGDSYALNIAMSGLSAGESGVFVYDTCLDIGTSCIEGMTSSTTTNYDFDIIVQSGEDYYIVVSSSAATGTLGYTLTLTETASPCQSLAVTGTTGATIPCIGSGTLTATTSGIGNDTYWYDAATGGNLVGIGPTFTTPQLTTTTSYWASEVISTGTQTSGYGMVTGSGDLDNPNLGDGLQFDVTQQFILVSVDIYNEHPAQQTADVQLWLGNSMLETKTVSMPAGNGTSGGPSTPTTVQLNFNIPVGTNYRLVLDNITDTPGDFLQNTGSYPYPLGPNGLAGQITSGINSTGTTTSSYFHFYNWTISTGSVVCESPRVQATATISTAGDITVSTPLPYSDTNDTANYGDPYEGVPGSSCGTTESYLNGNNVVYHFTATTTELVNISMSNLSGFYGGVFVYDSCADIGTACLAGAVNGPSDDDFAIMDFPVTAGEDYYIVVTSWLVPTLGYTLDIVPFNCANLEAPDGAATQDFPTGDTLSDLEVDPTRTGATLTWYAEPTDIPGNPIADPTTEVLVDGEDYCVTQTFNGCEGQPLCITVNEIDCTGLAITATTGDTVSCKGTLTLTATSSGTGNAIYWYDAATGGYPIETGPNFTTPELTTTTSYWVSEAFATGTTYPDQGIVTGSGDQDYTNSGRGLVFDAFQQFTIIDVVMYNEGTSPVTTTVELRDSGGNVLQDSGPVNLPAGNGESGGPSAATVVPLNFTVPVGTDYELVVGTAITGAGLLVQISPPPFPFPLGPGGGAGQITAGASTSSWYEVFYDWTISTGSAICESPRVQVDAVVNQSGDVVINHGQVAPSYTTTDNTSGYGDDFTGDPGTGCDGSDILGGYEVVYQYVADPANDNILDIELSGISNPNTGMYLYASCGDVGTNCLAGGTNEDGLTINIDDYYVTAGTGFFIVISSRTSTTNYTLTINGVDCANVAAPTVPDPSPYFIGGDFLSDLDIGANQYNTGLTWYAELSDIPGSPIADPTTETIVDGEDYYVTQTVLGCEGAPLEVIPEEFPCGDMKIDMATPDFYVCAPGGNVTLAAQGSGVGEKVYWYDAATGGNLLNVGPTYDMDVSATTSVWVSEVFLNELQVSSGYGMATWDYGFGSSSTISDRGLAFTANQAFRLVSVDVYSTDSAGGSMDVALVDNSGNEVAFTTVTLPSGSNSSPTLVTLPLNFDIPSPGDYQLLVRAGYPSMMYEYDFDNSDVVYPMPIGLSNAAELTAGVTGDYSYDYYYYHFYNWSIVEEKVSCESARTEITVTVNDQPTDAPEGLAAQKFCEGATLADVALTGTDIQWYDAATGGGMVSSTTPLTDGAVYYASQTVNACESDGRLEVTVYVDPVAAMPVGNINQSYYDGEMVSDLDVQGTNLTWYEEDGTPIADPTTFPLENYETYCVAQTPPDTCEGVLLCITVHEVLGVDDPLFESLAYHPNPVGHELNISNTAPMEKVALYDLLGRKVLEEQVNAPTASIDVSGLQGGTYLLWVTIDGKTGAFKVIKE